MVKLEPRYLWNRSIIPFACGLYPVVQLYLQLNSSSAVFSSSFSNTCSLSLCTCSIVPNCKKTWLYSASAIVFVRLLGRGMAMGHRVNAQMHVKMFVFPFADGRSGPTKSIYSIWKGLDFCNFPAMENRMRRGVFRAWQGKHDLTYFLMCCVQCGHQ